MENTPNYNFNDAESENTELNICDELNRKTSSFDKIKQKLHDEGSYSRIHLEKKAKKEKTKKKNDEMSIYF